MQVQIQHMANFPGMRLRFVYGWWGCGMRQLSFEVPGRIGGKGRPRGFIRGGKVAMHTPAKTKCEEGIVRHFAQMAMVGQSPMTGALNMDIIITRVVPKSWSQARRNSAIWVTGKPDVDNITKLISDALNGIAYADDSQIAQLFVTRRYGRSESVYVSVQMLAQ